MQKYLFLLITAFAQMLNFTSCSSKKQYSIPVSIAITDNWKFKSETDSNWMHAEVPGNIFTDLLKNNQIRNPFWGSYENELTWLSERKWIYKTLFDSPAQLKKFDNITLECKGLDTYADVFLNDSLIISADNMFRCWNSAVKNLLKETNELKIVFHSPLNYSKYKKPAYFDALPGKKRIFTRKAACQFGWDWAPNLPGCGIWQEISLNGWNSAKLKNMQIQTKLENNTALVNVKYDIESKEEREFTLETELSDTKTQVITKKLSEGNNMIDVSFQIENPKLWWTHNLGEPHLYTLKSKLITDNQIIDTITQQFGIRKIELVREKDSVGSSFYFRLNDEKVFMKGANYIPQDAFVSRVEDSNYKTLLNSVVDAHMNMLRVWGGGIYERDIFYELCDQYGILVWQDFMFANAMYCADEKFLNTIEKEATFQVKRLRNHPCMAIWCGNNEIDEAWHNWGWSNNFSKKDSARVWEDYKTIFHKLLPETVNKNHPKIAYTSSSPTYGRGNKRSLYEGDAHYWGVWHDGYDFSMFEKTTGRFMSEYGFQSFPDIQTLKEVIPEDEMQLNSKSMKNHQKHPRGNTLIKDYMEDYYKIPKNFEDFIYVSQLLQAEGIHTGIEAHRRAKPYCMGTLYWQLNDCWPVVSWSAIDYYGQKKALYYYSKESFKNIIVSHKFENNKLKLFIISDSLENIDANINLKLLDFGGKELWSKTIKHAIKKNSSEIFFSQDINQWIPSFDTTTNVLRIKVQAAGKTIEDKLVYFCKPKNMKLKANEIASKFSKTEKGYVLTLDSDYLIKNVYIQLSAQAKLSDNFFDILPHEQKKITIETEEEIEDVRLRHLGEL